MKEIPLTKGYVALVDDADYGMLSRFKWHANIRPHTIYAERSAKVGDKWTTERMHRLILGVTNPSVQVDHVNHDGLNNQRSNLRQCTRTQNQGNRRIDKDSTSGIKGVSWIRGRERWRAYIMLNGKTIHLGYFPTKEAAGEAYAVAARERFGDFAYPAKVAQ